MKKIYLAVLLSALSINALAAPAAKYSNELLDLNDTYLVASYGVSNSPFQGNYMAGALGAAVPAVENLYAEVSFAHQSLDLMPGITQYYTNKFAVSGVYLFPVEQVDRLSLIGKAGFTYTSEKLAYNFGYTYTGTGTHLTYGVGVQYEINKQIDARVMYEDVGGISGITGSSLNAGVVYHF